MMPPAKTPWFLYLINSPKGDYTPGNPNAQDVFWTIWNNGRYL